MTNESMGTLFEHALNYRIAPPEFAEVALTNLEEFVSKMCIAASDRWRDEWSEACNDNQILHNTCDKQQEFIKELIKERNQLSTVMAEIAHINPYDTSSMGYVVDKAKTVLTALAAQEPKQ